MDELWIKDPPLPMTKYVMWWSVRLVSVDSLHLSFITNDVILMMIIISCKTKEWTGWVLNSMDFSLHSCPQIEGGWHC